MLFACFLFAVVNVSSQTFTQDQQSSAIQPGVKAAPGTYQLICSNAKFMEVFTDDILYLIESSRDPELVKIITIGQVTKARILPYSVINDPGFTPLPDEIIYE